ncbi:helix-turn-helix domain-containing protein [Rhodospirillaceae bacterium KN72]|uniref:Helix-turn-helix domain-containing protein n=1 Tax=Pacificispira spongiicola TaxID=2729598 RepID=A0A7Y0E103_9PROT|nr:helix-turn-helix domain-containing protein [Pacificispira spongiicola]NMM45239.1 helix-turn-helix domain-containing protein [Pacificispira spongiicola]
MGWVQTLKANGWSSDTVPVSERTDVWEHQLCASYRDWEVERRVPAEFSASMRRYDLAGASLIECVCSPCSGVRRSHHLRRDDEPYLGVQIVLSGRERFRSGEETATVSAGDVMIWTSDREMEFEVTQRLHKITLMAPLEPLRARLPRGTKLQGGVLHGGGLGTVLFSHLEVLGRELEGMDQTGAMAAKRAALELTATLLSDRTEARATGQSEQYLRMIQSYILEHLHEEELSLSDVAEANRISVRYLHMLFAPTGNSASSWIQTQRLERCRDMLRDPNYGDCSVSEVGWRCGFKDASQFSRAFKQRYGVSPSVYRATGIPSCFVRR